MIGSTVYIQELSDLKKALGSEMEQLTLVKEYTRRLIHEFSFFEIFISYSYGICRTSKN